MDKAFKIAVVLSAYDKMSTIINSAVDRSQKKLHGFNHSIKEFAERSERGMIIGEGGLQFFEKTIDAAEQSEIALKRLEQVFKNRGAQGEEEGKAADRYAKALAGNIGIQHEEIELVQAKLAINKQIGEQGDYFNRATKTAFDIQAAGYGDASMNAAKLGKMLEHPVEGINAFARAGLVFSKGEKDKIKLLVESGHKFEAQGILLKSLEGRFHGVAENIAPDTQKAKVRWHELQDQIGAQLLPTINRVANFVTEKLMPAIESFVDKHPVIVRVLGAIAVGLVAVGSAARVLSFILSTNPIVLIIAAIATAAYLIYDNWGAISKWFSDLWAKVSAIFTAAWEFIKNIFLSYTPGGLIIKHWGVISHFFEQLWRGVKIIFSATWQWIKNMFLSYTPAGLIIKHWQVITDWFSNLWDGVKNVFSAAWEWIADLLLGFTPAGLIYKHWDEIVKYFTDIWDKVTKIFTNAWKGIKNGISSFFGFGGDVDKALDRAENALGTSGNINVNGHGGGLTPIPLASRSSIHFNPIINVGAGGAQDAQVIGDTIKTNFQKQMREYNAQQARKTY